MQPKPQRHTFRVGKRYTCTLAYERNKLSAEWEPSYPKEYEWHGKLLDDYLTGYFDFLDARDTAAVEDAA